MSPQLIQEEGLNIFVSDVIRYSIASSLESTKSHSSSLKVEFIIASEANP